ncbi:alpha,alpha-phosphotrehalase [Lactobacillus sp. ESL0703]|uniref:alpha,alpha-phosphotrehalase n=1 Tax=Lactobacillus sp. ESL0703 TaxID=2983218 RepID=UPI0023F92D66|nr:alpha,alpha-phosphotrehalase [Lactobacillus sp. ESL0703]MDF7668110.1 alpha,alpha-phosphotrehalase [Lactobacillus sp. ESL0703]
MVNLGKKVIYQIYPKSFYDSNGDGIGDIRGIIQKIPYIKQLNVDMIWFNPFFVSPQHDNGYDIANYYQIDPLFGTMAHFDELVAKLKEINVGVMLDMVFNHCSTSNEWFQKALAGDEKYRKFFYLRKAKKDGSLPTNWQSKFGGPAWAKFGDTDYYYLHLYDPSQADLDWHNPEVRQEVYKVINFWRAKGVQGFRFDVINVTGKAADLIDSTDPIEEKQLYTDTPIVHKYLKEMNAASFGQDPDTITVGEMSSTTIQNSIAYSKPSEHELSMVFNFHHLKVDYQNGEKWTKMPFDFMKLKSLLTQWQEKMDQGGGWNALFWNNHDQPMALNRFGDPGKYRVKSAEMLATAIHLMRGTPYIYMGEEIGMIDPDYSSITSYVDIESKNAFNNLKNQGMSDEAALAIVRAKSRDNSRTPMHWNDQEYAGFSKVKPWLMPRNQSQINVKKELSEGEIFNYYQRLIKLRKHEDLISDGHIKMFLKSDQHILAYERYIDDNADRILVFNNFYSTEYVVQLPEEYCNQTYQVLISNYQKDNGKTEKFLRLRPYEALAIKILA